MDMKYFIYCRKSSEAEDKQTLSNPAQRRELTDYAKAQKLTVVNIYEESKSAHWAGRPLFNEMFKRIEKGEANGIIVWDESRIARNAKDSGDVIYMMDLGQLIEIRKPGKIYHNTPDDKSWLAMCFMMSKKESDDKGVNVKRGLKEKAQQGWFPSSWTKPGYMWDRMAERGNKTILKDPDRFPLIEKAWKMMVTGLYSVPQILKVLNEEWGYTTLRRKTIGGNQMARSTLYEVFTDPFYYGEYEYPIGSGLYFTGQHETMITKDEYERVQILLGRKGKARPKQHIFPFTGLAKCGECEAMITAEEKWQVICPICRYKFSSNNKDACPKCTTVIEEMQNPTLLHYIYYHCTKRKNPNCTQKSVEVTDWEKQVDKILSEIEISPRFKDWAIKYINEENNKEIQDRTVVLHSQQQGYDNVIKQIDNLVKLKISPENSDGSLLPDDVYQEQIQTLTKKKRELKLQLDGLDGRVDKWRENVERSFNFACYARYWFANGDDRTKKEIMMGLGSNLILMSKILRIDVQEPLIRIKESKSKADEIKGMFEPNENADNTTQIEYLWTQNPALLPRQGSNLRHPPYKCPQLSLRLGLSHDPKT